MGCAQGVRNGPDESAVACSALPPPVYPMLSITLGRAMTLIPARRYPLRPQRKMFDRIVRLLRSARNQPASPKKPQVRQCAPRACGDGPCSPCTLKIRRGCSPRVRGWSLSGALNVTALDVLPARAGMVPAGGGPVHASSGAPRACGDGPLPYGVTAADVMCSPRVRGWSLGLPTPSRPQKVLPARAGMVPVRRSLSRRWRRAPRVCGDGPVEDGEDIEYRACSPYARGCFPGLAFWR
jgi:hypothetical protein